MPVESLTGLSAWAMVGRPVVINADQKALICERMEKASPKLDKWLNAVDKTNEILCDVFKKSGEEADIRFKNNIIFFSGLYPPYSVEVKSGLAESTIFTGIVNNEEDLRSILLKLRFTTNADFYVDSKKEDGTFVFEAN